jgi:hypothetical protein
VPLHELLLSLKDMKQLIRIRSRTAGMLILATKEGMVTLV